MDVLVVAENLPQKPFVHVFLLSYVVAMKEKHLCGLIMSYRNIHSFRTL